MLQGSVQQKLKQKTTSICKFSIVFGHFWLYNHASLRQQFVSRPKNSVTTWDEGSKLSVSEKQNRQGQQFETVVVMKLRTAFEKSGVQTRRITVISGNENKLILSFGGHNITQQKTKKPINH